MLLDINLNIFFKIDTTCVFIFIFKDMDKDEKILQRPWNFNVARQIFRIITQSINHYEIYDYNIFNFLMKEFIPSSVFQLHLSDCEV